MKRLILFLMLVVCILTACNKKGIPTSERIMSTDTIGVGILVNSLNGRADTITIVAKEKQENILLPDVEQVAEGNVSLAKIINGANQSRRIVLSIAVLIAALLFIRLIVAFARNEQRNTRLKLLAFFTLVCGWALYFIGYHFGGTASSFLAYFVRPLIASIGMFVGNTGYQELSDSCTRSVIFMTLFAIVHFVAIFVSAIFVVNFFWRRIKSYLKIKYWLITNPSTPLNVIFGLGKQSILLAKSIRKKDVNERILLIDLPTEEEGKRESLSVSQLFGFSAYNQEAIRELQDVKYAIKGAIVKPSEVESTEGDVLVRLGLRKLKKLIQHHKKTRIFFLSDDEVENIKSTINLMQDKTIKGNDIDIYCHARKNRENGVVEKMAYLEGDNGLLNVHIVDTSSLAIQILKRNVEYQPVSFVNPDTNLAVVDNPFYALILGFGETGRDALRFLYEFGAFTNSNGDKSPFKCYAIDKQMDHLKGNFYNGAPAVRYNKEIELVQMSNQSPHFWSWYEFILPKLNYVVISLGDDRSNMQAASDLFETACRVRHKDMANFKIFVRSYSSENEKQLDSLVKFYNDKCGATDSNGNILSDILVVFGKESDLFTYDNIIDDETLRRAKEFFYGYAKILGKYNKWDERHIISNDKNQITLNDINAVIRKENQDIANSLHMETKLKLIGLTRDAAYNLLISKDNKDLTSEQIKQKGLLKYILKKTFIKDGTDQLFTPNDRILKNIAICEHLRWNASHEMIGYELGNKTDEIQKKHNCLKLWKDLDPNIQNHDYKVMEKTIELIINEKSNNDDNKRKDN